MTTQTTTQHVWYIPGTKGTNERCRVCGVWWTRFQELQECRPLKEIKNPSLSPLQNGKLTLAEMLDD